MSTKFYITLITIVVATAFLGCKSPIQDTKISMDRCFVKFVSKYADIGVHGTAIYYSNRGFQHGAVLSLDGTVAKGRLWIGCMDGVAKSYGIKFLEKYNKSFIMIDSVSYSIDINSSSGSLSDLRFRDHICATVDSLFGELPDMWSYEKRKELEREWRDIRFDTIMASTLY